MRLIEYYNKGKWIRMNSVKGLKKGDIFRPLIKKGFIYTLENNDLYLVTEDSHFIEELNDYSCGFETKTYSELNIVKPVTKKLNFF